MPQVIVDLRNVPLPAHVREMSEDEDDGFYEMMVAEREAEVSGHRMKLLALALGRIGR